MNSSHSQYESPKQLLEQFVEKNDKFEKRFMTLLSEMNEFIEAADLKDKVVVNSMALGYALVDYFEDVRRLKEYHKLEHINSIKIVSYTSYWLLVRKPIQVLDQDKDLVYINERFVLAYILEFLSGESEHILERTNIGLKSFAETLFYFLKFRFLNAKSLELAITSFFAGQIYQERETDLSDKLAKYE